MSDVKKSDEVFEAGDWVTSHFHQQLVLLRSVDPETKTAVASVLEKGKKVEQTFQWCELTHRRGKATPTVVGGMG